MNTEKCASAWLEQLKRLLADHPKAFQAVNKLAEDRMYKEAFTEAQDIIADMKLRLDDDFKKADEDFYWCLM